MCAVGNGVGNPSIRFYDHACSDLPFVGSVERSCCKLAGGVPVFFYRDGGSGGGGGRA